MASELIEALSDLAKEKNIDELVLLERLEQDLARSYKQILGLEWDAHVTIDRETGKIYVYEMVGLGEEDPETGEYEDYEPRDVTPDNVSRIAAQNAKRVINEIVREAARANIYREFADRKGELITGTVLQSTPDFTVIKIREGVEAELPHYDRRKNPNARNEKPANEYYQHNQHIKALIVDVRDPSKQPATNDRRGSSHASIIVSRTHPDLIRRLLEIEVPEIYDGVVEVKSIAREAGSRAKIAVWSRESNLDPVGACVGPKGSRIRMVVSELRGERIDVIQWSEDPATYVANALSPAKVSDVLINEDTHYATVIVPDDQLSLAIGKEGQNARLAARLTGWHIDIKSASLVGADGTPMNMTSLIDDEEEEADDENTAHRCEFVSEDGVRCRNYARPGSRFCGVHSGGEEDADLSDDEEDSLI
ncbi:MAG: transcription termination factor NusA [Coriobacteriales bacterium]|jgi:N utilization substance protein A